ncbi:MAG: ATP-binding protein, partial [Dehalococcoidales bacterium]|nr:ATP-binding protein [Dehalococcoidales bacterium]
MENHSNRPEVIAALSSGSGQAIRYSATLHENMMYDAVPVTDQGRVIGISRVALPLTAVESTISSLVLTIIAAIAIVTLLVVTAAAIIAAVITRPVWQMTLAAEQLASGKLGQQIVVRDDDEIGRLGHAFNAMSASLQGMMEANEAERHKLATILSSLTDGVIMTDQERKILLANPAAERLFNFKAAAEAKRPLIETVHDHEIDDLAKKCLKTGTEQTTQLDSPGGRFLRVIAIPVAAGNSPAVLVLLQDLTELRSLQTMRRELIGNISHELRTPLAGIKAMVETLKDSAVEDKETAKDFLTRIEGEVNRLSQMVSEITQLSRIETGQTDFKLVSANLNLLINDVVSEMEPLAEKQQVALTPDLDQTMPLVPLDKERIRQTLINLVHNAIKFNKPGGRVIVSTGAGPDSVTVSVTDDGIGISPDDLPHVFDRFYKADKSRSRGGSGLGLAIAKHTVQAHGGTIWASSETGKGSTFTFRLPIRANPK